MDGRSHWQWVGVGTLTAPNYHVINNFVNHDVRIKLDKEKPGTQGAEEGTEQGISHLELGPQFGA